MGHSVPINKFKSYIEDKLFIQPQWNKEKQTYVQYYKYQFLVHLRQGCVYILTGKHTFLLLALISIS